MTVERGDETMSRKRQPTGETAPDRADGVDSADGDPLAVGESVPDARADLVRVDGTVSSTALSDLTDERPVLLCFYTMDFSPDCVKQWCAFRDFDWFAGGEHVRVVGVSRSGVRLHREFISRFDIGFPLFADTDLALSDAFGVTYRTFGLTRRSRRSCFLLDSTGTVRYRWLADHWLDPTRDLPPVSEIHEAVVDAVGPEPESFGF
jgi:peroxiredoxin